EPEQALICDEVRDIPLPGSCRATDHELVLALQSDVDIHTFSNEPEKAVTIDRASTGIGVSGAAARLMMVPENSVPIWRASTNRTRSEDTPMSSSCPSNSTV